MAGNVWNIPVSCQKRLKNDNKQKITVVEIVSTTVTVFIAGDGFEPTTDRLCAALEKFVRPFLLHFGLVSPEIIE